MFTIWKSHYENELSKKILYNINGWIILFLATFCTLPLIESCILINACGDSFYYTCYSPTHTIIIIIGIVLLIVLVGFIAVASFLFQLPDATSKIPWSLISSKSNLILLLLKLGLGIVHILDPKMANGIVYTLILIIFEALQVWMPFTNPIYSSVLIYVSNVAFNLWGFSQLLFNLYSFIIRSLAFNPYAFIFIQVVSIAGFILLRIERKVHTFLKLWINKGQLDLRSLFDSEAFFQGISDTKMNLKDKVDFWSNISSHQKMCSDSNCKCKMLTENNKLLIGKHGTNITKSKQLEKSKRKSQNSLPSPINRGGSSRSIHSNQSFDKEDSKNFRDKNFTENNFTDLKYVSKESFKLLIDQIEKSSLGKKATKALIWAAICTLNRLDLKYKAYFTLDKLEKRKISYIDKFVIYYYKSLISHKIHEEEEIENNLGYNNSTQKASIFMHTQLLLITLKDKILECIDLQSNFWDNLLKYRPDYKQLLKTGNEISHMYKKIDIIKEKIKEIDSSSVTSHLILALFFKVIRDDPYSSYEEYFSFVTKESSKGIRNYSDNDLVFNEKYNSLIIVLSGMPNSLGKIINLNNEMEHSIGYKRTALLNQDVNIIMPDLFRHKHKEILSTYISNHNKNSLNLSGHKVCILHSLGYLILCNKYVKIQCSENEIKLIGIISIDRDLTKFFESDIPIDQDVLLLLLDKDYKINCFSESFLNLNGSNNLSFKRYANCTKKIKLLNLYPSLLINENNLKSFLPLLYDIELEKGLSPLYNAMISFMDEGNSSSVDHKNKDIISIKNDKNIFIKSYEFKSSVVDNYYFCIISTKNENGPLRMTQMSKKKSSAKSNQDEEKQIDSNIQIEQKVEELIGDTASISSASSSSSSRYESKRIRDFKLDANKNNTASSINFIRIITVSIFAVLFAIEISELIFLLYKIDQFQDVLDANINIYEVILHIDYLQYNALTILGLLHQNETLHLPIKGFEDRDIYFIKALDHRAELVRGEEIVLSQFKNSIPSILILLNSTYKYIHYNLDSTPNSTAQELTERTFLNQLISRVSELSQLHHQYFTMDLTDIPLYIFNHYSDLLNDLVLNIAFEYFVPLETAGEQILLDNEENFNSAKTSIFVFIFVSLSIALGALIIFIPFFYLKYNNIMSVCSLISVIENSELIEIQRKIKEFKIQIDSSNLNIKKIFVKTNFILNENDFQDLNEDSRSYNDNQANKDNSTETTEMIKKSELKLVIKPSLIEYISNSKFKVLLKISIIAVIYCIIYAVKVYYFILQSNVCYNGGLVLANVFMKRNPQLTTLLLYQKMNLFYDKIFSNGQYTNVVLETYGKIKKNEREIILNVIQNKDNLKTLFSEYTESNTMKFCDYGRMSLSIDYDECNNDIGNYSALGANSFINKFTSDVMFLERQIESDMGVLNRSEMITKYMNNPTIITLQAFKVKYLDIYLTNLKYLLRSRIAVKYNDMAQTNKIFSSTSIIYLSFVFLIYLQILTNQLKNRINEGRKILTLLPTSLIRKFKKKSTEILQTLI